jgi:uncharacterized protein (TIGR02266 family)
MAHEAVLSIEGERALAELGPKLDAIAEGDIVRPNADPHGAALTALLVADWLGQPDRRDALGAAGLSPESVRELGQLARIILATVTQLGGDYLPADKSVPGELIERASGLRHSMLEKLDHALPNDVEVIAWAEAIRLGTGVIDLVYDLRILAELHERHASVLHAGDATPLAPQARSAADALEFALRSGEGHDQAKRRNTLARAWTLFATAYEKAASCARAVTKDGTGPRKFPPLALVATHRRARRKPVSVFPPARRSSAPPPGATVTETGNVEIVDMSHAPAPRRPPSVPPMPAAERQSWSESRREPRQVLELEVGLTSESNFFVGVTENLSSGGVFVATYAHKPIGSRIEIALKLGSGEELRLQGVVRWHRTSSSDGWPGIGVHFEDLTKDDEDKIRKFLSLREPMLYDV